MRESTALVGVRHPSHYRGFLIKPVRKTRDALIIKEWPNIQRIVASLMQKDVTQATVVRKLSSYTRQNQTKDIGGTKHSSSDGQRIETQIPTINARHGSKYFGLKKGVSAYTLVANHVPCNARIIGTHEHESHFVFDILHNNTTDMFSIWAADMASLSTPAAEGNPGEPAVGQIITDHRNGSIMQSCSLGSIHGGLAEPAQDYCFYQSDAVPLLAPTQNFRGVSAGLYQGFLNPPPFNNSEGAGTSSTAGFFANYRGRTSAPANTNGIWALNTYTYYENHSAPAYGYELDMNNASKEDDSGTNDAVALEILSDGPSKVGYAVAIGSGFENGVFISAASKAGLNLGPGMAVGIFNQSSTELFNNLYLFPSTSGAKWASPIAFGSQILNASGARVPDTYLISPNGGSGPNPYTTLNFTHPVAGGTGPSYYAFDSPIIAYGGLMLNPNTPAIPNTATGWAGNTAGKVVLALTGRTGTINGTSLSVSCDSGTATVTGAAVGHPAAVSSTTGADVGGAFNLRASVTAPDTVTVYICGTGTPPSLAYNVTVF